MFDQYGIPSMLTLISQAVDMAERQRDQMNTLTDIVNHACVFVEDQNRRYRWNLPSASKQSLAVDLVKSMLDALCEKGLVSTYLVRQTRDTPDKTVRDTVDSVVRIWNNPVVASRCCLNMMAACCGV